METDSSAKKYDPSNHALQPIGTDFGRDELLLQLVDLRARRFRLVPRCCQLHLSRISQLFEVRHTFGRQAGHLCPEVARGNIAACQRRVETQLLLFDGCGQPFDVVASRLAEKDLRHGVT